MAKVRIKLDRGNVRDHLLKSDGVAQVTENLANKINQNAGGGYTVIRRDYKNRVTYEVRDEREGSLFREANSGRLASAVRAAR
jgi:predicted small metal-binding protein